MKSYLKTFLFTLSLFLLLCPIQAEAETSLSKTLQLEHRIDGRFKFFNFSSISPDGHYAVLRAYEDKPRKDYLLIYDLNSGKQQCKISKTMFHSDSISWKPASNQFRIYSATPFMSYADIDVRSCQTIKTSKFSSHVFNIMELSPNKDKLILANMKVREKKANGITANTISPIVQIWPADGDLSTLNYLVQIEGHTKEIHDVVFTPDGNKVITLSADNTARIWDAATGAELEVIKFSDGAPETLSVSPKGDLMAVYSRSWSNNRVLYIIDIESGKIKKKIDSQKKADKVDRRIHKLNGSKTGKGFLKAWFSPDGSKLFTLDNKISVWEAYSGRKIQEVNGHTDFIENPNLASTFISEGWGAIYVHDSNTGAILGKSDRDVLPTSKKMAHWSDNSKKIIVFANYTVQIWNVVDAPCSVGCRHEAYKKPANDENLLLFKQAIDKREVEKVGVVLRRLNSSDIEIPETLRLDYTEFLLFQEELLYTRQQLLEYKKRYSPQSAEWARALKVEADFHNLIDRKIRYFHQQGNYEKVNARLEGRPYWSALTYYDYSPIFYEMVQAANKSGRSDVAKTYLSTYSKVNKFDKGHVLKHHQELMELLVIAP